MAISAILYTLLFTAVAAQPIDFDLEIREERNGKAFQTSILFSEESSELRNVLLAAERSYEIKCFTTAGSSDGDLQWVVRNSSDLFESIPVIDESSVINYTSAFVQEEGSGSRVLRFHNFSSELAGLYVCKSNTVQRSIYVTESDPAITLTNDFVNYTYGGGMEGSLRVFYTGNPVPSSVLWYKDGILLDEERRQELGIVYLGSSFNLRIDVKIKFSHAGEYTAVVTNSKGTANATVVIRVYARPDVSVFMSESPPTLGMPFVIYCLDSMGVPAPEFTWFFNEQEITSGTNGYVINNVHSNLSSLNVMETQFSHAGVYKCSSESTPELTDSAELSVKVLLSPPPQPILSASDVNYAGSNVTLNCTALLVMDSELLDETIEFVWKKNLKTVNVSSDSRLSEQAPVKGSGNTYTSVLRLSPSSIIADSGSYSCDVRVVSGANYSQYVSSVAKELLIKIPDADLEVTPDSIDILDFPPHNSIRITCAVSISEHINVPFMFKWLVNQVQLTDGSDGVSIKENGMSSVLISAPTSSGTLVYTCQFYLTFPHPDLPLMLFSNATVNIQGPVSPNVPTDASANVISYNTVQIQFTVDSIAYSVEKYKVLYGVRSDNLVNQSGVIQGNSNLSSVHESFRTTLSGLDHNRVYYYSIEASNSHGKVFTPIRSFQTPRIALVQFEAGPFRRCSGETVMDDQGVQNFFKEKLSERISVRCDCSFPQQNLVNGRLFCASPNSNTLIYRVYVIPTDELSSSEAVMHLEDWLKAGPTLVSGVAEIKVDNTCNLTISSITDTDTLCSDEVQGTVAPVTTDSSCSLQFSHIILGGVIVGVFFILMTVLLIILIAMICFQHRKLKRIGVRKIPNNYAIVNNFKRETSFVDPPERTPPSIPVPDAPTTQAQWSGDVSVSDCPAYLYSVKPLSDDDETQTVVERQPTPGIYDSIDGLNDKRLKTIQVSNPLTAVENDSQNDTEDVTGDSSDMS